MAREIEITETSIIVQKEVKQTGTKVTDIKITLDDGGCVICSFKFADKQFSNVVLWDENTPVSYNQIGQWTDDDVDARIAELIQGGQL